MKSKEDIIYKVTIRKTVKLNNLITITSQA